MFLVPSPTGLYICDKCLDGCNRLVEEHLGTKTARKSKAVGGLSLDTLPKPDKYYFPAYVTLEIWGGYDTEGVKMK